jgi:hypothetical protein
MNIHYHNIFAAALAVFALALAIRNRTELGVVIGSIQQIGGYASPEDKTLGLVSLILICVSIVAIVRILVSHQKDK